MPAKGSGQSSWQQFNPLISQALNKLDTWIQKQDCADFHLGILRLENLAPIIFTYDKDIALNSTKSLEEILEKSLGKTSKVVRIGIEDFLFATKGADEEIYTAMQNINTTLLAHGNANVPPLFYLFNVGLAPYNKSNSIESALDNAYIGLYECRSSCHTFVVYDKDSTIIAQNKRAIIMAADFHKAIAENRIQLAFQPIVRSKDGTTESYEALLRIKTEDGKLISAGPYIEIAEKFSFIEEIDILVFDMVYNELLNDPEVILAVNVSTTAAILDRLLSHITSKLIGRPDIAKRLIIEITETSMHRDIHKIVDFVDTLKALGPRIAIDDFGAGYTSFIQLKLLNIDMIKIDGSFIKDLLNSPDSELFVVTLQNFAKAFALETVAEFVENGEIAKKLLELDIDFLQGFYFNRPLNYRPWIPNDEHA
jgi:EAL domain-containing protein (putative c-di-GMP-specific phosphodiesterase class I)